MVFFRPDPATFARLMFTVILALTMQGCVGSDNSSPDNVVQNGASPYPESQINDPRRFAIQLSWDIPLARNNGDVLYANELAGYEILYSHERDASPRQLRIEDPLQTSAQVAGLPVGHYRFAIAAIDSNGVYSQFSSPVLLTLE